MEGMWFQTSQEEGAPIYKVLSVTYNAEYESVVVEGVSYEGDVIQANPEDIKGSDRHTRAITTLLNVVTGL